MGERATRRKVLQRFGIAGAVAWTAPLLTSTAAQAQGSVLTGTLYGCDGLEVAFYTVDRSTGGWTLVGPTGSSAPFAMAYDSGAAILYGLDFSTQSLYTVDPSTGALCMAYDSGADVLYGAGGPGRTLLGPAGGGTTSTAGLAFIP